jgi:uncharacterized protein
VKLLLWLALGLLVVWLLRKKPSGATRPFRRNAPRGAAESMIQCTHCRVHVPLSESIADASGGVFCSEEHRRLHVKTA